MIAVAPARGRPRFVSTKLRDHTSKPHLLRGNKLRQLYVCAVLAFGLANASGSQGTIHEGIADMNGWDFSAYSYSEEDWDLGLAITKTDGGVVSIPAWQIFWVDSQYPGKVAVMPPDSTYETLKEAPADDSGLYGVGRMFVPGRTWVCKTLEGHYAKFKFVNDLQQNSLIEYTYQDDGSRYFYDQTPVESTTWGEIKAFYSSR